MIIFGIFWDITEYKTQAFGFCGCTFNITKIIIFACLLKPKFMRLVHATLSKVLRYYNGECWKNNYKVAKK